jgi:transposase
MEHGFKVHAINPKQMDRFRDRFSLAGAKDDSRDGEVMASALRTDTHRFRHLAPLDPTVIELREWSRIGDELTEERTRLTNRLRDQLWRYFPAILELGSDLEAEWLLDLLQVVPAPESVARLRESAVARLLKRHRIRRLDAAQVLKVLRQPPLRLAAGTTTAASAHVATLITRIRLLNQQLKQTQRQIDVLIARLAPAEENEPGQRKQHDVEILASSPGVGRIVLATLLAEAFDPLQRRDYPALRSLTGVAPVTRRSGKSHSVVRRYACNPRLANAVYHWARTAMQNDPTSRAKYAALRSRGHSHGRALRSVGDRLLNVACAMLKAGTIFNPSLAGQKNA